MNKDMAISLVVLAAGMGSRYGGLKQMDPMGPHGETVLDYSLFDAIRAGFDKVIFVIRKDFEDAFRREIGARLEGKIEVCYAFQDLKDLPTPHLCPEGREKPWGTAHAIHAAREEIKEAFAVINADDFYGAHSYEIAAKYLRSLQSETKCAMVAFELEKTLSLHGGVNRGVTTSQNGILTGVEEMIGIHKNSAGVITGNDSQGRPQTLNSTDLVSMNFWAFHPQFLSLVESSFLAFLDEHGKELKSESYLPAVVDEAIKQEKLHCEVLTCHSQWFGVTYPADKNHVVGAIQALIENGDYPATLFA